MIMLLEWRTTPIVLRTVTVYPNLQSLSRADYRETAAKFQKEWHIKEPHRHFDFAPHIKSHALVSVINRGLIYNSLERQYAHRQVRFRAHAACIPTFVKIENLHFTPRISRQPMRLIRPDPQLRNFPHDH